MNNEINPVYRELMFRSAMSKKQDKIDIAIKKAKEGEWTQELVKLQIMKSMYEKRLEKDINL